MSKSRFTADMAILLSETISPNVGETEEGYLICKNVPVARTGIQYYLGMEMGDAKNPNKRYPVYRLEDEVFADEALKSLESKPITDDHPGDSVGLQNYMYLAKGHARNVRRLGNFVVADLIVTDPNLIGKIKNKTKYQISLGYACNYEEHRDGYKQTNIRINHVAVVEAGRAGPKVAIKDSKNPTGVSRMTINKATLSALYAVAVQNDKETFEELAATLVGAPAVVQDAKPAPDASLIDKLLAMVASKKTEDAKPVEVVTADQVQKMITDAMDALVAKLKDADQEEQEKTEDEDSQEEVKDEDPDMIEDEDPEEETKDEDPKEAYDSAITGVMARLKPLLAKMPEKQRKAVKDAIRGKSKNTYGKVANVVKDNAKRAESIAADGKAMRDLQKSMEARAAAELSKY